MHSSLRKTLHIPLSCWSNYGHHRTELLAVNILRLSGNVLGASDKSAIVFTPRAKTCRAHWRLRISLDETAHLVGMNTRSQTYPMGDTPSIFDQVNPGLPMSLSSVEPKKTIGIADG